MPEPGDQEPQRRREGGPDFRVLMLIGFVALLFFAGVGTYLAALDEPISTVRATRPVLVFTLIVAMLGFGGMLMFKSLFGLEEHEKFEHRFRLAREIFLVYAGIFGTIIGFYFGAADEGDATNPPSVAIAVRERNLTAQVTGGLPPFIAYLQRSDPALDVLLQGSDRLLTAQLTADQCPIDSTVYIVDGRGRRSNIEIKGRDIQNWPGCGEAMPPADETANLQNAAAAP